MSRPEGLDQRDYVQSLERGLSVILAFADHHPRLTLAEVAAATGLSRPTARRLLITLEALGYVRADGRAYMLTPHVLTLGYAYLNSLDVIAIAQPMMEQIVAEVRETCTLATLDGSDIVYMSRISVRRISSLSLVIGARLPAYASAMGQVVLADLSPAGLRHYFDTTPLEAITAQTLRTEDALRERLAKVRKRGWAEVDQELEQGLRSIAAPVRGGDGRVFAGLGLSSATLTVRELRAHVPLLQETAAQISARLGSEFSKRP
ncbi:MAG: IclR family transcriptional regulator [Naasia sp.]|nr:IclR family transcriptional regulator [Naasia sp.]